MSLVQSYLVLLGTVVVVVLAWFLVRWIIRLLNDRFEFLDLMTPGDLALVVILVQIILMVLAVGLSDVPR